MEPLPSGERELLVAYSVTAAGALLALGLGRVTARRVIRFPILAIPACVVGIVVCDAIAAVLPFPLSPRKLEVLAAIIFFVAGGLAGAVSAHLTRPTNDRKR